MRDSYNREITYARISVTDLCNMRCKYCMPDGVKKKEHSDILSIEELMFVSDVLSELGVTKQRITGGEPLVRRGVMTLFQHIGENERVKELGITTNGQCLSEVAYELKSKGVNLVNISLDTLDKELFYNLTGGGSLDKTVRGIESAIDAGFQKIKLNAVLLRGINDGAVLDMARFAKERDVELRFIELMPFSEQMCFTKEHFISSEEIVKRYNLTKSDKNDDDKKVVRYVSQDGLEIGFISAISHKFCESCRRIRITADGKLMNCLHANSEFNLKPYLNDRESLKEYILACVLEKPLCHRLDDGVLQTRGMENIGG